ncbi:MAG: terminase [Armatimonadia bacterium]
MQHEDGTPWRFTNEQFRFILHWYAIESDFRWTYREGILQRLKGWGKDPLGCIICSAEFVGPCRPTGRLATPEEAEWLGIPVGQPIGRPHPQAWVQTAAVSITQTKNTMTLFPSYLTRATLEEYEISLGKEIIYAHQGAQRIEAVTSSPRTLEGSRPTLILKNETQHWVASNEGHAMDAVIARNLAKSKDGYARALAITNAYEPGEDSVAQVAREAWEKVQAGQAVDTGVLYDSLEAPPEAELSAESAPAVIAAIRGDSTWLDIPRIVAEIMDIRNPASRSRRFYYNQIIATEDAWTTPQAWDALADSNIHVAPGEQIALGFDGGETEDHTALQGSRISDGFCFNLGLWDPQSPEFMYRGADGKLAHNRQAFLDAVDATVRQAFTDYDVVAFFSDIHPWESYITQWDLDLGRGSGRELCVSATAHNRIGWDMRARGKEFTLMGAEWVHDEIEKQAFRHDGNLRVRQHVLNARNRPNNWGMGFGKEHRESQRKVDALAALILSRMARRAYLGLSPDKQRRKRRKAAFY